MKTYFHKKTCTCMFIEALLIMSPKQKQSKCPLIDEWIKLNAVYPYNRILFSNKNELSSDAGYKWLNLENILLSQNSQSKRPCIVQFHLCICMKFLWGMIRVI